MSTQQGIRITVEDLESGESETKVIRDDVMVVVHGTAHVSAVSDYPSSGTQQWTIKGIRRGGAR